MLKPGFIELSVNPGLNINNVRNAIKTIVVNYINNLPIGEPLIVTKLIQTIQNSDIVISCKILDNVWVIETNTSFSEIRDQISFIGKSRCKIFIMDYVNRWSSVNIPRETTDYLKK